MLTYYVVFCRVVGLKEWWIPDQKAIPSSYEAYPVLYQSEERAKAWAEQFKKDGNELQRFFPKDVQVTYETKIVQVLIPQPIE